MISAGPVRAQITAASGKNAEPESGALGVSYVSNAPFVADVTTEISQVANPGAHTEERGKIYRDSKGRTRSEKFYSDYEMIFVNDAVQNIDVALDPQNRVAGVRHCPKECAPEVTRGLPISPRVPRPQPFATSWQGVTSDTDPQSGRVTRIEKLGTREIAGLLVYGTRVTRTSPESKPDSEHLVWSYESWYSPELQMDVLSMIDPPWSGRTIRRLVNIQRIEPEAALFEIPEGYTMQRPRGDSGQGGRAAQENLSNERPQAPTP